MFDTLGFRSALSRFATGVTIISVQPDDGPPLGLTVNSFNSVSLDPPLVLWSLNRQAQSLPIFGQAGHFGISVLAADQIDLSRRFASSLENRFENIAVFTGTTGAPLIQGSIAWFDCKSRYYYEGGDHLIFVGEVLSFGFSDQPALLYEGGKYKVAELHPDLTLSSSISALADKVGINREGDVAYFLAKASKLIGLGFHEELKKRGFSLIDGRILSHLLHHRESIVGYIANAALAPQPTVTKAIDRLCQQNLVQRQSHTKDRRKATVTLTEKGRDLARFIVEKSIQYEKAQLAACSATDVANLLSSALDNIIRKCDPMTDDVPEPMLETA
ncbi:MAG: flavin reductase [Alphaproteobacteria bacterium]